MKKKLRFANIYNKVLSAGNKKAPGRLVGGLVYGGIVYLRSLA